MESSSTIQNRFKVDFLNDGSWSSPPIGEAIENLSFKTKALHFSRYKIQELGLERRVQRIVKSPSEPILPLCYDKKGTDFV